MTDIREQIEELNAIYDEACYPTHTMILQEPEYTCEYCNYHDVAPGHTEECLVVPCKLAANSLESLLAEIARLNDLVALQKKDMKVAMDEQDKLRAVYEAAKAMNCTNSWRHHRTGEAIIHKSKLKALAVAVANVEQDNE